MKPRISPATRGASVSPPLAPMAAEARSATPLSPAAQELKTPSVLFDPSNDVDRHLQSLGKPPAWLRFALSGACVVVSRRQFPQVALHLKRLIQTYRLKTRSSAYAECVSLILAGPECQERVPDMEWRGHSMAVAARLLSSGPGDDEDSEHLRISRDDMCRLAMCVLGGLAGCPIPASWDDLPPMLELLAYTFPAQHTLRTHTLAHLHFSPTQFACVPDLRLSYFHEGAPAGVNAMTLVQACMNGPRCRGTATLLLWAQLTRMMHELHLSPTYRRGLWLQLLHLVSGQSRSFLYPEDQADIQSYFAALRTKTPTQHVGVESYIIRHAETMDMWQRRQRHELRHIAPVLEERAGDLVVLLSRLRAGLPVASHGPLSQSLVEDCTRLAGVLRSYEHFLDTAPHVLFKPAMMRVVEMEQTYCLGLGPIMCRGLGVAYVRFLRQLRARNGIAPDDRAYRGPLSGRHLSCSEEDWERTVSSLLGEAFLSRVVYAAVYDSQHVLFVVAGELDWRLLCLCSHLRAVVRPLADGMSAQCSIMPLYLAVARTLLCETDIDHICSVLYNVQTWWDSDAAITAHRSQDHALFASNVLQLALRLVPNADAQETQDDSLLSVLAGHMLSLGAHLCFKDTKDAWATIRLVAAGSEMLEDLLQPQSCLGWTKVSVSPTPTTTVSCVRMPAFAAREFLYHAATDADVTLLRTLIAVVPHVRLCVPPQRRPVVQPCALWAKDIPAHMPLLTQTAAVSMQPAPTSVLGRLAQQHSSARTQGDAPLLCLRGFRKLLRLLMHWEQLARLHVYTWPAGADSLWDMPVVFHSPASYSGPTASLVVERCVLLDPAASPLLISTAARSGLSESLFNRPEDALSSQKKPAEPARAPAARRRRSEQAFSLDFQESSAPVSPKRRQAATPTRSGLWTFGSFSDMF